jgi:alanine racemase
MTDNHSGNDGSQGSRVTATGSPVRLIHEQDYHAIATSRCWAEIDLSAFRRNLRRIREVLGEGVSILLPVKADAYGHGCIEITNAAREEGISWFGVSAIEEAIGMRQQGIDARVVFLTPPLPDQIPLLLRYDVTPVLTSMDTALLLGKLARQRGSPTPVHVEIDTGMSRTGFAWQGAAADIDCLSRIEGIRLEGVMTHFSKADARQAHYSTLQRGRFLHVIEQLPVSLREGLILHAANSAASLRLPGVRFSMVRPGLYPYGVMPIPWSVKGVKEPEPVMSLRAKVLLAKTVERGDKVSYGGRWTAPGRRRIATVSAGYRDGVEYALSRGGRVLIRGRSYAIAGSVCMDMMMADLVSDHQVAMGDIVTIIGRDGEESISVREIAGISSTIPYDILCSVGMRVPRLYRMDGAVVKVQSFVGAVRRGAISDRA